MAQNVNIIIRDANPEKLGSRAIPLVLDFGDFQHLPAHREALWILIPLISGVAFNPNIAHHMLSSKRVTV
jgi:hypothetical protein